MTEAPRTSDTGGAWRSSRPTWGGEMVERARAAAGDGRSRLEDT